MRLANVLAVLNCDHELVVLNGSFVMGVLAYLYVVGTGTSIIDSLPLLTGIAKLGIDSGSS